jgi:hypothetical protein
MLTALLLWLISPIAEPACTSSPGPWPVCLEVARAARAEGVDPHLAVALAWSESRMRHNVESPAGALGPLQVIPRYWCPDGRRDGCDLTRAGARALRVLIDRHGPERGICHYASGNVCTPRALRYARYIIEVARGQ